MNASVIKLVLDGVERTSYAAAGFRWHLSAIVEALHCLSGCKETEEYRRTRSCLDDTSCRQCGAKDGELRSKLMNWGDEERKIWTGERWEQKR